MKERQEGDKPNLAGKVVVDRAIDVIIEDLRSNWRVEQPTKYEQVLEIFRSRPEGVTIDKLSPLYEDAADPDDAARKTIAKLNTKLRPLGLRIERPLAFHIVTINPDTEN